MPRPQPFRYCPQCATELTHQERDGALRGICTAEGCGFVHWNNPTPVLAAVVEQGDDIILIQNKGWPRKIFALVSGFLEANEDPAAGMLREIDEELGVPGEIVDFLGLHAFARMNQLLIGYHVRLAPTAQIDIGAELADYRRIAKDRVRPWDFGTGPIIQEWQRRYRAANA